MSWINVLNLGQTIAAYKQIKTRLEDGVVYVVGTNVEYAIFVEGGTRHMSAQPFLGPAMREAQRNIQRITAGAETVAEAVKKVALFIERRAAELAPVDTGNLMGSIRAERVR